MTGKGCQCDSLVFEQFTKDLQKEIDALQSKNVETGLPTDNYNKETHWKKMDLCCELISKECTKMALAFSKPPLPSKKDSSQLLQGVAKAVDMLLAWYKCFPLSEGKILHNSLDTCILNILTSVATFTDTTLNLPKNNQTLISTGSVWEHCEQFKKLPFDNMLAAIQFIDSSYNLITDAINEIKETLIEYEEEQLNDIDYDDDDDCIDDTKWTEEDKKLIKPVIGLLMASKGLLKKSKFALNKFVAANSINHNETDLLILDHLGNVSPCVDELVMVMYPPVDKEEVLDQGNGLVDTLCKTLLFLKNSSFGSTEENKSWIEFIQKAVHHNIGLLKDLIYKNEND